MKIAGIDIGTSNIKALIINSDNSVIEDLIKVQTPLVFHDQFLDVELILNAVKSLVNNVREKYGVKLLGISSMAPVLTLVNHEGRAIGALMYNSLVGSDYLGTFDEELFLRINLNPPNVQMIPQKIMWLRDTMPNMLNNVKYFVDLNGYIFMKLTNETKARQDTHIALEWGLLDHKSRYWSYEIIDSLKIRDILEPRLPELIEPTYISNNIVIGTVDVVTSALGLNIDQSKAFISCGTTLCAGTSSMTPRPSKVLYNDLYLDKGYLINGCNSMYGSLIDWFKSKIAPSLNLKVEDANFIPTPLIFLPYLIGERSPIFNPKARGVIFGLRDDTDINELWKSLIHSLAYITTNLLNYIVSDQELIIAYGGLAREPITTITASLVGKRIAVVDVEASALGAAIIAAKSYGLNLDIKPIIERNMKVIEPKYEIAKMHERNYILFNELYKRIEDLFKYLS